MFTGSYGVEGIGAFERYDSDKIMFLFKVAARFEGASLVHGPRTGNQAGSSLELCAGPRRMSAA